MPAHAIDLETKEQGQIWLLPPYSYSIRQIADELDVGVATVQKWRQQLADNGHQLENDRPEDNSFSAVIDTGGTYIKRSLGWLRNLPLPRLGGPLAPNKTTNNVKPLRVYLSNSYQCFVWSLSLLFLTTSQKLR